MPFSLKMKVEIHVPPDNLYETNVNSTAALFIITKKWNNSNGHQLMNG